MFKLINSLMATALVSGCAIKPIPDDVTFVSTVGLVAKVRCEVQDAIWEIIEANVTKYVGGDGVLLSKAELSRKDYRNAPPILRKELQRYDDAVIVLDFQLRMTEKNGASGGTNLVRPFTSGFDVIGLKFANSLERQNYRTFRINTDISDVMRDNCASYSNASPNYQYPISGKIGLKETFISYFGLVEGNKLGPLKDWTGDTPFVDTIKFTTEVSGEFDPSFNLQPSGRGYVFRDAGGILGAGRKDEHQLIVGISFPVIAVGETPAQATRKNARVPSSSTTARSPDRSRPALLSSPTRAIVNDAVNRAITKQQLFGINPLNPLGPLNQ